MNLRFPPLGPDTSMPACSPSKIASLQEIILSEAGRNFPSTCVEAAVPADAHEFFSHHSNHRSLQP